METENNAPPPPPPPRFSSQRRGTKKHDYILISWKWNYISNLKTCNPNYMYTATVWNYIKTARLHSELLIVKLYITSLTSCSPDNTSTVWSCDIKTTLQHSDIIKKGNNANQAIMLSKQHDLILTSWKWNFISSLTTLCFQNNTAMWLKLWYQNNTITFWHHKNGSILSVPSCFPNNTATVWINNTVELKWLEHLLDHENMFETGVVRANEC